jgi:ACS family hexuronate transporter-like MFS transporter
MEAAAIRPHSSSWRWWITGLLLLATAINYMDRTALAGASKRVTDELGLDEAQYGHLEWGFGWAFAAGSLVFGCLANRFRIHLLYPAILAGWSLTGMATGWAQGFTGLLVCRTLLGFFEAGHWPCAVKTTFTVLSERERTLGNSIMQSGASIGAVLTPQILRLLLTDQAGSWRSAFVVVGAVGLVWVVLWFLFVRPQDLESMPVNSSQDNDRQFASILLSRRFWAVALLIVGAQTVWHI